MFDRPLFKAINKSWRISVRFSLKNWVFLSQNKTEMIKEVYIVAAVRTPMGAFMGGLSTVPATTLGATAIKGALSKGNVKAESVDEVIMGNVLQAGVGQAPARQAAMGAG